MTPGILAGREIKKRRGMVLPFQPLSMCFRDISYYVDVPMVNQLQFNFSKP